MEVTTLSTFSIFAEDLYVLSVLMKVPYLVGIGDPFEGMLAEEVEPITQASIVRLKESGILSELPDGELTMDSAFASIFDTLISAKKIITVTRYMFFRGEVTRYIHLGTPFYVEMETMPGGHVELSVYMDATFLVPRLLDFLSLPNVEHAKTSAIELGQKIWGDARKLALNNEIEECIQLFVQAGVESETAKELTSAIVEDSNSGSLTIFGKYANQFQVESQSGWVANKKALWKLETRDQYIFLIPCTYTQIAIEIGRNL